MLVFSCPPKVSSGHRRLGSWCCESVTYLHSVSWLDMYPFLRIDTCVEGHQLATFVRVLIFSCWPKAGCGHRRMGSWCCVSVICLHSASFALFVGGKSTCPAFLGYLQNAPLICCAICPGMCIAEHKWVTTFFHSNTPSQITRLHFCGRCSGKLSMCKHTGSMLTWCLPTWCLRW